MVVAVPGASLEGKVALVTGGGRGIGRGVALELGKRGASVVVNYVSSKAPAEEVCKLIEGYGNGAKAIAIQADVSKVPEIRRLFKEAKEALGRIDIVMSNSGTESWDKTEEITEEKYDHVFNLNTRAQFFVGQEAFKVMEDNGRIILMTSIAAGLLGVKDHALYNASKMAVRGFVKAFATDFGRRGITCNGIAPGGIKSDMFAENAWHYIPGATPDFPKDKIETMMAENCPMGRCALPEDVAKVVGFLASPDSEWVNGTVFSLSLRVLSTLRMLISTTGEIITISGGSSQ
jgi:3-oxoacyl-[acyl-carrier protein] reductase